MLHVLDTGIYLRPNGSGLLVGDGDARWRGAPSEESSRATTRFLASTQAQLSSMLGRPARCAAAPGGLVAMTPDRRPVLRRLRLHDGEAWLFGGFGGDGLSLAPAYGEMLAEELLRGE
jgi:glycine/D-amino acid oxidase-like deaminating enzyme